jgi:hypothetical protein
MVHCLTLSSSSGVDALWLHVPNNVSYFFPRIGHRESRGRSSGTKRVFRELRTPIKGEKKRQRKFDVPVHGRNCVQCRDALYRVAAVRACTPHRGFNERSARQSQSRGEVIDDVDALLVCGVLAALDRGHRGRERGEGGENEGG